MEPDTDTMKTIKRLAAELAEAIHAARLPARGPEPHDGTTLSGLYTPAKAPCTRRATRRRGA